MVAWGELSAKSSHMIGNRVFALKGDINELKHLLKDQSTSIDQLQEIQVSLTANVMRIEEILQDFRDFVTATQLDTAPVDFNEMVRETVKEVFPKRSPVTVEVQIDETLPPMMLDSKKLRRAVSELLENAVNYMPEGVLRVVTGVAEQDLLRKARQTGGRMAKLEIEDSGPGVPEERKKDIFQPFYSSRVKGMGLGLSIVKGIVDAHGGVVFEDGKPGVGARFVILLPMPKRPRKEI
jgi:signal transduction histidine kinase